MRIQTFKIKLQQIKDNRFNLGLYYFKYLPFLKEELSNHGLNEKDPQINWKTQKDQLLEDVVKISQNVDLSQIKKRFEEIKKQNGIEVVTLKTQSRFLCGVGYQSRIEWGFTFDWTTGIPYLPGSSFKGALLSYLEFLKDGVPVEKWKDNKDRVLLFSDPSISFTKEEIETIFGPQGDKIKNGAQGKVVFFDVYPLDFKGLEIDVITPHYTEYYVNKKVPADIYNPVPQYFLTVPKETKFQFMFKLLSGAKDGWAEKIKALIKEAGENYGFGAKTATGYGYFK